MSEGMGNKLKSFFGLGDVESYEDPYYRDSFAEDRERREPRSSRDVEPRDSRLDRDSHLDREDRLDRADRHDRLHDRDYTRSGSRHDYRSNGVATPARGASRVSSVDPEPMPRTTVAPEPKVVRMSLSDYRDSGEIAQVIKEGDVVVFNLGGMEKGAATRVLDFVAGLSRGVDADLKKLPGVRNFVLIPSTVKLQQSQLDQLVEDN